MTFLLTMLILVNLSYLFHNGSYENDHLREHKILPKKYLKPLFLVCNLYVICNVLFF